MTGAAGPEGAGAHTLRLPGGYEISDARDRLDMGLVADVLAGSYWARGRPPALTLRSWANSLCLGLYAPEGRQIGGARILTDRALRAHLADVFVLPETRGRGLGRALVEAALAHPDLATVTRWTLTTADAHGLYAGFGFRVAPHDEGWMVLERGA